jgi:hypothetical protein
MRIQKKLLVLLMIMTMVMGSQIFAQQSNDLGKIFLRIYDMKGRKMATGKILSVADDGISLKAKKKPVNIAASDIGKIKTKRSGGHNVLMGAGVGAATGIILGVASSDPNASFLGYSATEGATGFGVLLGATGAAIGGITVIFKKPKTYDIEGDAVKWEEFRAALGSGVED